MTEMNPLDTGEEFQLEVMNPNPTSSKTKDGPKYRVSFEMSQDDWQCFMDANTNGMVLVFAGRATQIPATIQLDPKPKPKGGPISKAAAMLCQDEKADEYAVIIGHANFKEAIYARCGISSRSELDHDDFAAERYEELKGGFIRWAF
jgi:hypothetical protein